MVARLLIPFILRIISGGAFRQTQRDRDREIHTEGTNIFKLLQNLNTAVTQKGWVEKLGDFKGLVPLQGNLKGISPESNKTSGC